MGVLRMGYRGGKPRSVYDEDAIKNIFRDHPYADAYTLTVKLGRRMSQQSITVRFRHFNDKDCLDTILQFARKLWKAAECGKKNRT